MKPLLDNAYFYSVDETLHSLRDYLLGFSLNFTPMIPAKMTGASNEKKAEYLTDRLLFGIMLLNPSYEERIQDIRSWLFHIICFLYDRCMFADYTFANIIKISELSLDTREILFDIPDYEHSILARELRSPVSRYYLERAIGILISADKTPLPGRELMTRIVQELEGHCLC